MTQSLLSTHSRSLWPHASDVLIALYAHTKLVLSKRPPVAVLIASQPRVVHAFHAACCCWGGHDDAADAKAASVRVAASHRPQELVAMTISLVSCCVCGFSHSKSFRMEPVRERATAPFLLPHESARVGVWEWVCGSEAATDLNRPDQAQVRHQNRRDLRDSTEASGVGPTLSMPILQSRADRARGVWRETLVRRSLSLSFSLASRDRASL